MSSDELTFDELAELTEEVSKPGGGHGPVAERVNQKLIAEFRANQGQVAGAVGSAVDLLLVVVTAAKSGKKHVVPLAYFKHAGRILIVASMGGSDKHPQWHHNLMANPDCTIEVGGEIYDARAVETTGADRDELYDHVCATLPVFTEYQQKTSRLIPVVELQRVG